MTPPTGSSTATTPDSEDASSPYQGLMPYTESRADLFFGRDQDIVLIANNARAYPLSLLYGPSGVGKSSVLQAGVLRHIRRENERRHEQYGSIETVVAYTSDWRDDPLTLVARAVNDAFVQTLASSPDAGERLDADAILNFCAEHEVDLLLILDQFEEFFLYHQDAVEEFADELALLLRPGARANVLLSIREDALAQLDQFEDAIPDVFDNTLRLEHLDEESARSAIVEPLRHHNEMVEPESRREIEPALVDALIEEVQAGRVRVDQEGGHGGSSDTKGPRSRGEVQVEAPFLQLVLTRLWDEEAQRGSAMLRASTLRELGGAQEIVRQHLDRVVHLFNADELSVMVDAFGHLVTPSGSKIAHTASDLAALTSHDTEDVRSVLRRLCRGDQRILREVPGPLDQPDAEPRFEIFHDVLALAVLDWRRRWLADASAQAQQAQLAAAKKEAELQTHEAHRRLRRARLVISGLGVLVAACLVLAFVAVNARDEASRNAALDDVNKLLALDPSAALARALESWDPDGSAEYEDALRTAMDAADTEVKLTLGSPVFESFFLSNKDLVTVTVDGFVRVWHHRMDGDRDVVDPGHAADVTQDDPSHRVTSAALAGDQRYVVVGSDYGTAYVMELATGDVQEVEDLDEYGAVVEAPPGGVGNLVMVSDSYESHLLYDVTTSKEVELPRFPNDIRTGTFDASGRYFAVYGLTSGVRVWDMKSRRLLKSAQLSVRNGAEVEWAIGTFTHAKGGQPRLLIAATANGQEELQTWNVSRDEAPVYLDDSLYVLDTDVNENGELAVATSKSVNLYQDGTVTRGIATKKDFIAQVRFNPQNGHMLVLGDNTGVVEVLDGSEQPLWSYRGHAGPITTIAFSPDGARFATGSGDGTVRVWRTPERTVLWRRDRDTWALHARYTPDGRYLVGVDQKGKVVRLDRRGSRSDPDQLVGDPGYDGFIGPQSIDPAPDGSAAVVVPEGQVDTPLIATFDGSTAPALKEAKSEYFGLNVARWSPDTGKPQVAGGTVGNTLEIWRVDKKDRKTVPLGDDLFEVADLQYSKNGSRIAAVSTDGRVYIVRAADGKVEKSWPVPPSSTLDISSDGRYVVTAGDDDQKVRIWDSNHPSTPLRVLTQARGRGFTDVAFSPDDDSKRVAVASSEGLTYVWARQSGRLVAALRRNADYVNNVGFDPRNLERLITASDDATISIFECDMCRLSSKELATVARARVAQEVTVSTPVNPGAPSWAVPRIDFGASDGD